MNGIDPSRFSPRYAVRKMGADDADMIYALMCENAQYFAYCGRGPSLENIREDLEKLPPGKMAQDKYYVGFFAGNCLLAVLDLIDGYPDEKTAYIGFFMMNIAHQGQGIGSRIILELFDYLEQAGFSRLMLGYDRENPQSRHFWHKNGFQDMKTIMQDGGAIIVAQRLFGGIKGNVWNKCRGKCAL